MQALHNLNNVQKAKILFEWFPQEIAAFVQFEKSIADTICQDPQGIMDTWEAKFFAVDFWIYLAETAQKIIAKCSGQLSKSSRLFAEQLFDGYAALFAAHCLQQYVKTGQHKDTHFKIAVELFFGF
jgi:hypothetical protein